MIQRAAAIYVVFFVVVAAGAYAFIGAAQQPTVSFQNPDYELSANETFTVSGTEYSLTSVAGGGDQPSAEATWTNQSAQYTQTWDNNSTVTYEDTDYRVLIPNESDPSAFTLREEQNVSRPTVTQNGTTYVVVGEEGQNRTLVPVDEYLPEPETREFEEGQTFGFQGNQTTIGNVTAEAAPLQWTAPRTNTVSFSEGGNVTLGDQQFVAHFPDNETLQLSSNVGSYQEQQAEIGEFNERITGLWGVVILSGLAAVFLLMLGFLPARE